MTVELSEQDISRIVEALDHMAAYQRAVNRDHAAYLELGDRLQALKKPPVSVTGAPKARQELPMMPSSKSPDASAKADENSDRRQPHHRRYGEAVDECAGIAT